MLKKYHVGEFITEYMEVANISETELSNGSGVSRSHINKLRTGRADLNPEIANKIADILGVKASLLLNLQLSYIRYTKTTKFIDENNRIYKMMSDHAKSLFVSNQNISIGEFSVYSNKGFNYAKARGFSYYSPNKSSNIKNYILLKIVEAVPNSRYELDIDSLSNYVNTIYKSEIAKIVTIGQANSFLEHTAEKLYEYGINTEISNTGLNTTIKGLTKIRNSNATVFVENKKSFLDTIWFLTHELMHILNPNINTEDEINELAMRVLIGKYANSLDAISNEELIFKNSSKFPEINKYIFANIWRYKKGVHNKKTRKDIKGDINDILYTQLPQE